MQAALQKENHHLEKLKQSLLELKDLVVDSRMQNLVRRKAICVTPDLRKG